MNAYETLSEIEKYTERARETVEKVLPLSYIKPPIIILKDYCNDSIIPKVDLNGICIPKIILYAKNLPYIIYRESILYFLINFWKESLIKIYKRKIYGKIKNFIETLATVIANADEEKLRKIRRCIRRDVRDSYILCKELIEKLYKPIEEYI